MKITKTLFLAIAIAAGGNIAVTIVYAETGYFGFIKSIFPTEKIIMWGMFVPLCFFVVCLIVYLILRQKEQRKKMY